MAGGRRRHPICPHGSAAASRRPPARDTAEMGRMKPLRGAARRDNALRASPVLDCFMFSNELDVLDVRLAELAPVVDLFVLVESPITHQGKPKPLHFAENAGRFERYRHKIRHVVVNDMPLGEDHWRRERHQRDALRAAIADAGPHDLVVVSDVDEIPRASTVALARKKQGFVFLELALNYYYFNLTAGPWLKAYAAPKQVIDRMTDLALPRWRELAYLDEIGRTSDDAVIRDAGWHFTWQGGVSAIMSKLDAFAHAEFRRLRNAALIERAMRDRHFFIGNEALHEMPTDRLPATVRENLAHYRQKGCLAPARDG